MVPQALDMSFNPSYHIAYLVVPQQNNERVIYPLAPLQAVQPELQEEAPAPPESPEDLNGLGGSGVPEFPFSGPPKVAVSIETTSEMQLLI